MARDDLNRLLRGTQTPGSPTAQAAPPVTQGPPGTMFPGLVPQGIGGDIPGAFDPSLLAPGGPPPPGPGGGDSGQPGSFLSSVLARGDSADIGAPPEQFPQAQEFAPGERPLEGIEPPLAQPQSFDVSDFPGPTQMQPPALGAEGPFQDTPLPQFNNPAGGVDPSEIEALRKRLQQQTGAGTDARGF